MAGFANTKVKLQAALEEIETLKSELRSYRRSNAPKVQRIVSQEYTEAIVDELIGWSEEGLFLDECLANWGIDQAKWEQWIKEHDTLRAAVGPARARAKASMLKTLREALKTRSAFPISLADRIIAMVEKENKTTDESADGLIRITVAPSDHASPPTPPQVIGST